MKEGLLRGWVGGWLCGGGECCLCVCGRRGAAVADTISISRRTELSVIFRTAATLRTNSLTSLVGATPASDVKKC